MIWLNAPSINQMQLAALSAPPGQAWRRRFVLAIARTAPQLIWGCYADKPMTTEWFRNVNWSEPIERTFNEKLRRARRKEQYLRIQASTLARSHPEIALKL